MLRIISIGIASLYAAFPLNAQPSPSVITEADGQKLEYTAELMDHDFVRLSGIMLGDRRRFILLVSPLGQVDGRFGNGEVSYSVPKRTRDRLVAALKPQPTVDPR
jgi:hypothetical protein